MSDINSKLDEAYANYEDEKRVEKEIRTNRKHNWFSVYGDIRIDSKMSAKEFTDKLDELGLEFLGTVGISNMKDEDYD